MTKWLAIAGFLGSIPAANWLIGNVGECIPHGPCLVPVGFGLMAPSGVFAIGAALVFRDAVHEAFGWRGAMLAILIGAALSWFISPHLALASAVAFLLAETADLLVYAPLRRRALAWAVLLSGMAGAAIDSAAFLWLAFGSLDYLAGQVVGKAWASLAAVLIIWRCGFFFHRWGPDTGGSRTTRIHCERCGAPHPYNGTMGLRS
jgi:uncharacterized PurR-regulated membrane protein YhhQ (DUF165 family)